MPMDEFLDRIPVIGPAVMRLFGRKEPSPEPFTGSASYWEKRYASGGHSGGGSLGDLARFKADVINAFVRDNRIERVVEFGCGDGNQLLLAEYSEYIGFDVSPKAISLCREKFADDASKSFRWMDLYAGERARLTLSLDVIYHLIEDDVFDDYMCRLFDSSDQFVIVYSSNKTEPDKSQPPHIRHREFTTWVSDRRPEWTLVRHLPNKYPFSEELQTGSCAEFYIFENSNRDPD